MDIEVLSGLLETLFTYGKGIREYGVSLDKRYDVNLTRKVLCIT